MKNSEIKRVVYNNVYQNTSNGYVLTPSELAFEMVSTLPNDVFKSEKTTFLDPICKSGTFLFEIVERLYDEGHVISNIQKRIYTIDSNSHSLNVANSYINKILNRESGYFKVDFKYDFIEKFFNRLVSVVTSGKHSTFDEFISIIILEKNDKNLMVELKNSISDFISKYEKVSKLESKLFGEVFTPRQLIDEMLDTLPVDVWGKPDLKWLDPAVGIGNFPAAILDRLMVGLESVIPNEDDRRKHILEEMLFMCDISTKNLFLLYQLFDRNNEFKLNVYRGSFLTEDFDKHMKDVWGLEGFDVVVGNPPYNKDGVGKGGGVFWKEFVFKSFRLLNEDGFLNMVHPTGWRKPKGIRPSAGDVWDLYRQNNLIYVKISDEKIKGFPTVDFYTVQKNKLYKNTFVKNKFQDLEFDGNIALNNFSFLPHLINNKAISIINKLINNNGEKLEIKYDQSFKPTKADMNESGLPHSYFYDGEKYLIAYKSYNVLPDYLNQSKIIMTYSNGKKKGNLYAKFFEKPIGNTRNTMFYLTKDSDNVQSLVSFLNSKIIKFLLLITQYSDSPNHKNEFKILNLIAKPTSDLVSDCDFYEYLNLTQEEIDLIEKTIKD
jgi:hypothetical protein